MQDLSFDQEKKIAKEKGMEFIPDPKRGPDLFSYQFGNTRVWSHSGWRIANLVGGHYANHATIADFAEACDEAIRRNPGN